jgi:hypothetical protein
MAGLYSWGSELPDEGNLTHYRFFQGGRFQIKGTKNRNVSFNLSYRAVKSFGDYTGNEYGNRLYNAYLRITSKVVDLNLGRQYVFAGVGYGTMDGAKATFHLGDYADLVSYAGTVSSAHEGFEFQEWDRSHMFGVHLKTDRLWDSDLGLSFINKERTPNNSYSDSRNRSQESHLFGLDFRKDFTPRWMTSTRLEMDVADGEHRFDRAEVYTRVRPGQKWFLSGEYYYRKPRIRRNSIFRVFRQYDNQEVWMKATVQVNNTWSLYGGVSGIFYHDESATRLNAGFTGGLVTVNLFKTLGYAGSIDGGTGGFQIPLHPRVTALGGIYLSRYKLYEDADDYDNMASSYWGLSWMPTDDWTVDAEAQALHNKVFSRDMRFFFRLSRRVSLGR